MIIDKYAYPYRLDLLLTKRDFKKIQEEFVRLLKKSKDYNEAINTFQNKSLLPVIVGYSASVITPKKIEDFYFFLLIDEESPYGK